MRAEVTVWVALGANLGDARGQVETAIAKIEQQLAAGPLVVSRLYRSAPHEAQGPDYVNAVVRFATSWSAPALLDGLQGLENQAGRERPHRHAPRTLDLDLLFYGEAQMDSPRLTLPHPRWADRAFVLYPLADVSPDKVSADMMAAVSDQPISLLD
jgi:2-amino-4-hydroxy-6-hydroxymethyldihydropteridine diphosphokinase